MNEKEELLLQIEQNPDIINTWPTEKLLKLEKIYDDKIEQYKKKIAVLEKFEQIKRKKYSIDNIFKRKRHS